MSVSKKILIFRQSSLGDVILTLPVLDLLRGSIRDCQIDYFTKAPYEPIVKYHPAVCRVLTFGSNKEFRAIVGGLGNIGYDLFIDLQANFRSHYIRFQLPGVSSICYKKRRLAREFIVRRPGSSVKVEHTILAYLKPLQTLGIEGKLVPPILHLSQEAFQFGEEYWGKEQLGGKIVYGLSPGARHPEKMWPWERYRELALRLIDIPEVAVLVFSTENDKLPANLEIDDPKLFLARNLGLLEAAALLGKCRLAITNDSGLMHLANSAGTPTIAIFGPTHPRLGFGPTFPGSRVICDDVPCSPCSLHGQRRCHQPRKFCFENITPERILAEINNLIGG